MIHTKLKQMSLIFEQDEITQITQKLLNYRQSFLENKFLNLQLSDYILISNYITYIISNLQMNSIEQKVDIKKIVNEIFPNLIYSVSNLNYKNNETQINDIIKSQLILIKSKLINIINSLEDDSLWNLNVQHEFLKNKFQSLAQEKLDDVELNNFILNRSKTEKKKLQSGYLLYQDNNSLNENKTQSEDYVKILMIIFFILLVGFFMIIF